MGFNEFCASAQNSKKRPRQTIHLSGTGLSLKQVCESGAWRGMTGGSGGCMRMPRKPHSRALCLESIAVA
jgi:hypothetical protein